MKNKSTAVPRAAGEGRNFKHGTQKVICLIAFCDLILCTQIFLHGHMYAKNHNAGANDSKLNSQALPRV